MIWASGFPFPGTVGSPLEPKGSCVRSCSRSLYTSSSCLRFDILEVIIFIMMSENLARTWEWELPPLIESQPQAAGIYDLLTLIAELTENHSEWVETFEVNPDAVEITTKPGYRFVENDQDMELVPITADGQVIATNPKLTDISYGFDSDGIVKQLAKGNMELWS